MVDAGDIYLVDIVVREFHGEVSFNLNHYYQAIEPIGPKIISEVRLIHDAFDVDAWLMRNGSTNMFSAKDFFLAVAFDSIFKLAMVMACPE